MAPRQSPQRTAPVSGDEGGMRGCRGGPIAGFYAEGVTSQLPRLRGLASYPGSLQNITSGFYAEGVTSQSPGLRCFASYPGYMAQKRSSTPKELHQNPSPIHDSHPTPGRIWSVAGGIHCETN